MSRAITFTVHDRELRNLRAAADVLHGVSIAELVRDALRHRGYPVQSRLAIPIAPRLVDASLPRRKVDA